MITVTIGDLRTWDACDLGQRVAGLRAHLGRDVPDDEPVPLAVWAEVPWGDEPRHSDSDLRWALGRTSEGRRSLAALSADYAERALPIWEARYPGDRRPREAVEVVREWLCGEADIERFRASAAAVRAAAQAATHTVGAAYAATYAVTAVYAAAGGIANAAAAAAADAAHAACAAPYAACAAERAWQRHRLLQYLRGEVTP